MKKLLFLTITIGLFYGVSCFASGGYKLTNQIKNGGFEYAPSFTAETTTRGKYINGTADGSDSDKYKWGIHKLNSTIGNISAFFDSSQYVSGKYSMKVRAIGSGTACGVAPNIANSANTMLLYGIPALPGATYPISGYMKTNYTSGDATTGSTIQITTRTRTGAFITISLTTLVKTTTNWTYYTANITNPTTVYVTPVLLVKGNDGAATLVMDAWFDDIRINMLPPTAKTSNKVLTRYANP